MIELEPVGRDRLGCHGDLVPVSHSPARIDAFDGGARVGEFERVVPGSLGGSEEGFLSVGEPVEEVAHPGSRGVRGGSGGWEEDGPGVLGSDSGAGGEI